MRDPASRDKLVMSRYTAGYPLPGCKFTPCNATRFLQHPFIAGNLKKVLARKDYIPFTKHEGPAPYFSAFGFFLHVKDLGGLVLFDGHTRSSFIKKSAVAKTLQQGVALYSSRKRYLQLQKDLRNAFTEVRECGKIMQKNFTKTTVVRLFDAADAFSLLYRSTEYFYTENAYRHVQKNKTLQRNLATFDTLKLYGRSMVNALFYNADSVMSKSLRFIAKKFALPFSDIQIYKGAEILALFDDTRVSRDVLTKRKRAYVIYGSYGNAVEYIGKDALHFLKRFHREKKEKTKLRGQTAQRGVVTGKARVVFLALADVGSVAKVLRQMKAGEILVADTTIPEVLPACRKAAGIITNQGGMLSHAAIVSRELQIPCLVGTNDATTFIKTGDTVYLNATAGLVSIEANTPRL